MLENLGKTVKDECESEFIHSSDTSALLMRQMMIQVWLQFLYYLFRKWASEMIMFRRLFLVSFSSSQSGAYFILPRNPANHSSERNF